MFHNYLTKVEEWRNNMPENNTYPGQMVFGLDIGTRSIVGTVGYKEN